MLTGDWQTALRFADCRCRCCCLLALGADLAVPLPLSCCCCSLPTAIEHLATQSGRRPRHPCQGPQMLVFSDRDHGPTRRLDLGLKSMKDARWRHSCVATFLASSRGTKRPANRHAVCERQQHDTGTRAGNQCVIGLTVRANLTQPPKRTTRVTNIATSTATRRASTHFHALVPLQFAAAVQISGHSQVGDCGVSSCCASDGLRQRQRFYRECVPRDSHVKGHVNCHPCIHPTTHYNCPSSKSVAS